MLRFTLGCEDNHLPVMTRLFIIRAVTFLPVAGRHLRALSRKAVLYWMRSISAFCFTGLAMLMIWEERWMSMAQVSQTVFMALASTAFIMAAAAVLLTADSISVEKRDGTLGLLFLTDLRGFDVVTGNLVAHGSTALYMLGAGLPVMALPLLMGGVTWTQFLQAGLVILNTMFFSLCLGLFVSSICKSARAVYVLALLLMAWFCMGVIFAEALVHDLLNLNYHEPIAARISPFIGLMAAIIPGGGLPNRTAMFWQSVGSTHVMAWLFFIAAARITPRVWQERALSERQMRLRDRLKLWSVGHASERKSYRTTMLDENPICWLDDRYRLQKSLLWGVFLAALTLLMWMFSMHPMDVLDDDVVMPTIFLSQAVLVVWMAFSATHRLAEDKRGGALELLLSTPISVQDILRGRRMAHWRQFGWVTLCVQVASGLLYAGMLYFQFPRRWASDYFPFMITMGIGGMLVFTLYHRTLFIVGQWLALITSHALAAAAVSLVLVVSMHWGLFMGVMLTGALIDQYTSLPLKIDEWDGLWVWIGFGIANCLFWSHVSKRQLQRHFRELAARQPRAGELWEHVRRRFGMIRR